MGFADKIDNAEPSASAAHPNYTLNPERKDRAQHGGLRNDQETGAQAGHGQLGSEAYAWAAAIFAAFVAALRSLSLILFFSLRSASLSGCAA